jgi:hypothetical protein
MLSSLLTAAGPAENARLTLTPAMSFGCTRVEANASEDWRTKARAAAGREARDGSAQHPAGSGSLSAVGARAAPALPVGGPARTATTRVNSRSRSPEAFWGIPVGASPQDFANEAEVWRPPRRAAAGYEESLAAARTAGTARALGSRCFARCPWR